MSVFARPASAAGPFDPSGQANVPRLALRKPEAAAALGVSDETFDRYVRPTLPVADAGTVRLYPVTALAAWLEQNARAPVDELVGPS